MMQNPSSKADSTKIAVLVAALVLVAGAVVGMSSVFAWVGRTWYSFFGVGVYSHGYLVFVLAIWIGWTYWRRDPPRVIGPWWWGILPLAVLVAGMGAMELLFIGSSRALLLPPLFLASVALVYGPAVARLWAMPAVFIYFGLLPFWAFNQPLQALATQAVNVLMGFGGVPFYIEEFRVQIPAGTFQIATACSGLSFLLSAMTLATFYSAMYLRSWPHRIVLLTAAATAALVSNWIRIWTLILIGQATSLEHWLIDDHYFYGWVLFIIALGPVLYLARWLEDRELARAAAQQGERSEGQDIAPARRAPVILASPVSVMLLAALAGAVVLSLPRHLSRELAMEEDFAPLSLPEVAGTAQKMSWEPPEWRPGFRNSRQDLAVYAFQGQHVDVIMAHFPAQDREHHLFMRRERDSVFTKQWRTISRERIELAVGENSFPVNEVHGRLGSRERVMIYWFEVADRTVTTRIGAKLAEVAALPSGRNDGMVLAIAANCTVDCEATRDLLRGFLAETGGILRAAR